MVAVEAPESRLDADDAAAHRDDPRDGGVLQDAAALVLQRPGVGLHGALRIGLAAKMIMDRTDHVIPGKRHQLARLLRVEHLVVVAHASADIAVVLVLGELRLGQRHDDALAPVFGRVAEQLVHLRPEPLLLGEQRALVMRRSAAVTARRLPADDSLVEHDDVDPRSRQPPSGAKPRDPRADHDDRRTLGHVRLRHACCRRGRRPAPPPQACR